MKPSNSAGFTPGLAKVTGDEPIGKWAVKWGASVSMEGWSGGSEWVRDGGGGSKGREWGMGMSAYRDESAVPGNKEEKKGRRWRLCIRPWNRVGWIRDPSHDLGHVYATTGTETPSHRLGSVNTLL
jgi:hypothetical protein